MSQRQHKLYRQMSMHSIRTHNKGVHIQNDRPIPTGALDQPESAFLVQPGIAPLLNEEAPPAGVTERPINEYLDWYRSIFNAQFNSFRVLTLLISDLVLQDEPRRMVLRIRNRGVANIHVEYGQAASATTSEIIVPGGLFNPTIAPVNSIHIIGVVANQPYIITEGVV